MKDEIALEVQKDKASEAYVELLFLWKLYEDGEFQITIEQATLELSKLSTARSKRNEITQ